MLSMFVPPLSILHYPCIDYPRHGHNATQMYLAYEKKGLLIKRTMWAPMATLYLTWANSPGQAVALQILSSVHAFYVCPPAVYTSLPVYWLLKAWAQCHTNVPCLWKERCNNNRKCVVAHYHSRLSVTSVVELELAINILILINGFIYKKIN